MTEPFGVYVHWPWCLAKCPYCDFNSHAVGDLGNRGKTYVEAVCRELEGWKGKLTPGREISSVFFGGGTPSLMGGSGVENILSEVAKLEAFSEGCEITVECNPTSSSKTLFKALREAGVNRVSIGVQGLRAEWLKFLGREHGVDQALRTLEDALEVFENVNADVIYGLPGQDVEEWRKQLEMLAGMGVVHVSAYQLTIEKNTRFFSDVRRGLWEPVDGDMEADFFDATREVMTGQGFENYEISNFCRPGKACVHNQMVWQGYDYLGVGAGAHGRMTMADGVRYATQVIRQPEGYLSRMEGGTEAFHALEVRNGPVAVQEALLLGLRLAEGVDSLRILKSFGEEAWKEAVEAVELEKMVDTGFLSFQDGKLSLTALGWPRLNAVLKRILKRAPQLG